jgi:hypothetical protein
MEFLKLVPGKDLYFEAIDNKMFKVRGVNIEQKYLYLIDPEYTSRCFVYEALTKSRGIGGRQFSRLSPVSVLPNYPDGTHFDLKAEFSQTTLKESLGFFNLSYTDFPLIEFVTGYSVQEAKFAAKIFVLPLVAHSLLTGPGTNGIVCEL